MSADRTEVAGALLKRFAYFGGVIVLESVLPYLLGGKDLFEPLDLSTAEGRREQVIRLAVAVQLLPDDAATSEKLSRIMPILLDRGRKSHDRTPSDKVTARNQGSEIAERLFEAISRRAQERKQASPASPAGERRQVA